MPGARHCAVNNCKSSSKNKTKQIKFFKFPNNINEDWRRVVGKDDPEWKPKTNSVICSHHFARGDISGNRLRDGAIPIPEQFKIVHTG